MAVLVPWRGPLEIGTSAQWHFLSWLCLVWPSLWRVVRGRLTCISSLSLALYFHRLVPSNPNPREEKSAFSFPSVTLCQAPRAPGVAATSLFLQGLLERQVCVDVGSCSGTLLVFQMEMLPGEWVMGWGLGCSSELALVGQSQRLGLWVSARPKL